MMKRKDGRDYAAGEAAGRRNLVENELELSNKMIARGLRAIKDNLLVIRMDVAGLTQWGTSWRRERVCGRGGIRKNCGKVLEGRSQRLGVGKIRVTFPSLRRLGPRPALCFSVSWGGELWRHEMERWPVCLRHSCRSCGCRSGARLKSPTFRVRSRFRAR